MEQNQFYSVLIAICSRLRTRRTLPVPRDPFMEEFRHTCSYASTLNDYLGTRKNEANRWSVKELCSLVRQARHWLETEIMKITKIMSRTDEQRVVYIQSIRE